MTSSDDSKVLTLLQPDLLTLDELKHTLLSRCCRPENLDSQSKDRLVELFRRFILPLPQRSYRANRRGKFLTARRMKAGLEGSRRGGGPESQCRGTDTRSSVIQHSGSRLKPPPNISTSTVISTTTRDSPKNSVDLDRIVINDRTKSKSNETKGSSSPSRVVLKRPSGSTSSETSSPTENKKQRVAIKWP